MNRSYRVKPFICSCVLPTDSVRNYDATRTGHYWGTFVYVDNVMHHTRKVEMVN